MKAENAKMEQQNAVDERVQQEKQKMRLQSGFSLVEILVVLVIMGLLISVVAPTVLNRALRETGRFPATHD